MWTIFISHVKLTNVTFFLMMFQWNVAHLYPVTYFLAALPNSSWFSLANGYFKFNFDGSTNLGTLIANVGGIVRKMSEMRFSFLHISVKFILLNN